ncbi:hypothetical protein G7Y89_g6774 [Cudoniella acicularis]|uniref:Major facilitator superfamily (MFS) profile domain-containing protein n=1 Tax=Cudoniella acicularis TaxID=354080 RepID=A0A8H4RM21_9HELO|nr:hypothetical protein G7Y89_g6774 [Cudoniella acicularis]
MSDLKEKKSLTEVSEIEVVELPGPTQVDRALERKLLRKLDLRILPVFYLLSIISHIDRANLGNVRIEGILVDLHMVKMDYNKAILVFMVACIVFELPSSLMVRRFKPGNWIATIMLCWGIVTLCTGFTQTFSGLLACRFIVGSLEAGFGPCVAYLISQYYKRHEFQIRYSLYSTASQIGGAFGGFLAFALAKMGGLEGYKPWRWIFIMEGVVTIIVASFAFFFVVPLPENATFLKKDEKDLLISRLKYDQSESGADADTEPLTLRETIKIGLSWKVLLTLVIFFVVDVYSSSVSSFQPTILKNIGWTSSEAQIHTIPVYMTALVFNITFAFLSFHFKLRSPFIILGAAIGLVGWILELTSIPYISPTTGFGVAGQRYAGMFLIAIGGAVQSPILVVWLANNMRGRKERIVSLGVLLAGAHSGNVVTANVFITSQERKGFPVGFAAGSALAGVGVLATIGLAFGYWMENKKFAKKEKEEIENGGTLGEYQPFRNTL